jgi:hypothetical protein
VVIHSRTLYIIAAKAISKIPSFAEASIIYRNAVSGEDDTHTKQKDNPENKFIVLH